MKMKFLEDKFYNGQLIFRAGEVYEVSPELGWAGRWLKRGGIPAVEEAPVEVPPEAPHPHGGEELEVEMPHEKSETTHVQPVVRRGRKPKNRPQI